MARYGPRAVTVGSGLLCAVGTMLGGLAVTSGRDLPLFTLLYAGILGAGIGLGYTSPMVAGYSYFPQSKARARAPGCLSARPPTLRPQHSPPNLNARAPLQRLTLPWVTGPCRAW